MTRLAGLQAAQDLIKSAYTNLDQSDNDLRKELEQFVEKLKERSLASYK